MPKSLLRTLAPESLKICTSRVINGNPWGICVPLEVIFNFIHKSCANDKDVFVMGLTKGLRLGEQRRPPPKVARDGGGLGALAPVADSAIRRGARVALPASRGSDHRRPPSITQAD